MQQGRDLQHCETLAPPLQIQMMSRQQLELVVAMELVADEMRRRMPLGEGPSKMLF
jgi:hypothetical protein